MSVIGNIFRSRAQHLLWKRLKAEQVVDGHKEQDIQNDEAYFLIRMKEMYLRYIRKLWRKFYPMLHGYVSYGNKESHAVAGPGQLKELGEANLERVVNLNYCLAGPIAYRGGDVSILVGLYSVPGQDAAKALLDTVGTIAGLGGFALGQSLEIANAVKTGVENLVGLNESNLELGIRDTFYQNNPFRTGYYVGINAPEVQVPFDQLWLKEGRLVQGADPIVGVPYEDHDYFILEVESRIDRTDWPGLPGIAEFQEKFAIIMRDGALSVPEKKKRLAALWPQFQQALAESPFLIRPDREQIALSVANDLKKRLEAIESGNPFETRAWGEEALERKEPAQFDFMDVPKHLDFQDAGSVREAQAALKGDPFAD